MAIKRTNIKRYGNIYGRGMGAGSWPILVAMFFGVMLFGIIGWSLYTPVHELVMKLGTEPPPESTSAVSAAAPEQTSQTPESVPENVPPQSSRQHRPANQGRQARHHFRRIAMNDTGLSICGQRGGRRLIPWRSIQGCHLHRAVSSEIRAQRRALRRHAYSAKQGPKPSAKGRVPPRASTPFATASAPETNATWRALL